MKSTIALLLATILAFAFVVPVDAQAAESIWLTADTVAYKTGETVTVAVNAISTTPVQGFTFQIRYDPACLRPINAASTIPGMNALPLPQVSGLADGSYASSTPQNVNGILAQVRFTALKGCQTNLVLESAALAIRNESGFAAPLPGVAVSEQRSIALNIDKAKASSQPDEPVSGAVLPLAPVQASTSNHLAWITAFLVVFVFGIMFGAFKLFRIGTNTTSKTSMTTRTPMVNVRHGPNTGESFTLDKLPCFIGRDPINQICLNDPQVIEQHAKIYTAGGSYYLMDLGGETVINGRVIRRSSTILKPGDVVRLGKRSLLVFGS